MVSFSKDKPTHIFLLLTLIFSLSFCGGSGSGSGSGSEDGSEEFESSVEGIWLFDYSAFTADCTDGSSVHIESSEKWVIIDTPLTSGELASIKRSGGSITGINTRLAGEISGLGYISKGKYSSFDARVIKKEGEWDHRVEHSIEDFNSSVSVIVDHELSREGLEVICSGSSQLIASELHGTTTSFDIDALEGIWKFETEGFETTCLSGEKVFVGSDEVEVFLDTTVTDTDRGNLARSGVSNIQNEFASVHRWHLNVIGDAYGYISDTGAAILLDGGYTYFIENINSSEVKGKFRYAEKDNDGDWDCFGSGQFTAY